jgi:hypothetical protein
MRWYEPYFLGHHALHLPAGRQSALRGVHKTKVADSINLACAASAGMDLFLTGDKGLVKLIVPGIQFVAHFENPIL